jgi:hypothetical protein
MEDRDFVPHPDGSPQFPFDGVLIIVEIRQQDDEATPLEQLGCALQRRRGGGAPARLDP